MTNDEMEKEIDAIVDRHFPLLTRTALKLAILDAYKAGMEAGRRIYREG